MRLEGRFLPDQFIDRREIRVDVFWTESTNFGKPTAVRDAKVRISALFFSLASIGGVPLIT